MKTNRAYNIKSILISGFLLAAVTGIFTGGTVFLFRVCTNKAVMLSDHIFSFAENNGIGLIFLLLCGAALGLIASLILHYLPICKGGGIPTSLAIVRGYIRFDWLKSIFGIFTSSLLTFLAGVPLGNEGPSVQIGTSVGKGTVNLLAKGDRARERYFMTGGACAGFAAATGAPLSGLLLAFEEAQRRFTPMIFMVASISVVTASAVSEVLGNIFHVNVRMFSFSTETTLPLRFIWTAVVIGIVCASIAVGYTRLYSLVAGFAETRMKKIPLPIKVTAIFLLSVSIGCLWRECNGSGHDIITSLSSGEGTWYLLCLLLCIRALLLILANVFGVTGGLFVPTLTLGAIIGVLCFRLFVFIGVVPGDYGVIMMTIGMASFLSSASRTPLTALAFSIEVLGGSINILPFAVGISVSYMVIEMLGIKSFNDTVVEGKIEAARAGKEARIIDTELTVSEGSFADGKEIRDILFPPNCTVLSILKNNTCTHRSAIAAGDSLHIYCKTYDYEDTMNILEAIVGKQKQTAFIDVHDVDANHQIPNM